MDSGHRSAELTEKGRLTSVLPDFGRQPYELPENVLLSSVKVSPVTGGKNLGNLNLNLQDLMMEKEGGMMELQAQSIYTKSSGVD